MTLLENEFYKVTLKKDETFSLDSADNRPYDVILNPGNITRSDYYKAFAVDIDDGAEQKRLALVGSIYGADSDVAILEGARLTVLMHNMLTVIDCGTLSVLSHKKIPGMGVYFTISKFDNGYIVWGELAIVKLSPELEVEWSFSGEDIFVSPNGNVPFAIAEDTICISDWNGRKYKLNKFGQEILE